MGTKLSLYSKLTEAEEDLGGFKDEKTKGFCYWAQESGY
jgi:hypothetical protein